MAMNSRVTQAAPKAAPKAAPVKVAAKPAPKAVAAPAPDEEADNVISPSHACYVTRGYTMKVGDDFVKFSVMLGGDSHEEASAAVSEAMVVEAEAAMLQYQELRAASEEFSAGAPDDEEAAEAPIDDDAVEGEDEPTEDGVGPDEVRAMTRPELIALVKEHEIGVDPKSFPANKAGLSDFREAVIDIAFAEAGEEGEEEAAVEEDEAPAEEEEAGLSAADIRAMSRNELIALNKENALGVPTKSYPELADLANAIIEAAGIPDEEGEEAEEEEEPAAEEEEAGGYTEAELKGLKIVDLKGIFKHWKLGAFPAGTDKVASATAIKKILAAQSAG